MEKGAEFSFAALGFLALSSPLQGRGDVSEADRGGTHFALEIFLSCLVFVRSLLFRLLASYFLVL